MMTYTIWKAVCNEGLISGWNFCFEGVFFGIILSMVSIPMDILFIPIYLVAGIIYGIIKLFKKGDKK